ncbi:MAG: penicillin-binding protein 1A [Bacteriovoracia bacterium]
MSEAQPLATIAGGAGKTPPVKGMMKFIIALGLIGTAAIGLIGALVFWQVSRSLPQIISLADYKPLGVTQVIAQSGSERQVVGEFFKEKRFLVPYDKLTKRVIDAFVSAEDDTFFQHQGISLVSIMRAGIANFRAGHVVQGGSTITQQVAKSLFLSPERNLVRKLKEAILAGRIEKNLTKQQILYLYLNQIYLGHGAYGIQAASRVFFNKDVSELSLAEAALLAGMPRAPSKFSPLLNPKRAKERQLYVLKRMYENGFIKKEEMVEAGSQPLKIHTVEELNDQYGPYYVEHLRKYLTKKYGEKAVLEEGLTVYVPPKPRYFKVAQDSLRRGLHDLDHRQGYRGPLQVLKTEEEIKEFRDRGREEMIRKKIKHSLFLPDGRMDMNEALVQAGITNDAQAVDPDRMYEAVVLRVDDAKKEAIIGLGSLEFSLPIRKMLWARKEASPGVLKPAPDRPSQVVAKGDVVLVRIVKAETGGQWIAELDQYPQVQGGLFSMEAESGYVLAMEGGYDFSKSEYNRAVQAMRQPGSAFKPIIYAAAVEKGYTPSTIIVDSPIVFKDDEIGKWKPNNFTEKFYGDTTFQQALEHSRNVPTVKILQDVQISSVIEFSRRLGFTGKINEDLSISLGSATTSLVELSQIYSTFPRMGQRVTPIFVTKVIDRDGNVLEENLPQKLDEGMIASAVAQAQLQANPNQGAEQVPQAATANPVPGEAQAAAPPTASPPAVEQKVALPSYPNEKFPNLLMDPRVASVMTQMMKDVVDFGTGHDAKTLGRMSAGKTGTTNDYVDAWFMGFTPDVVTGVWVGFDEPTRTLGKGETGARAALPIWLAYMREVVKDYPDTPFKVPPGIVFANIDADKGLLAGPKTARARKEAFIAGTEPTERAAAQSTPGADSQSEFFKEDFE